MSVGARASSPNQIRVLTKIHHSLCLCFFLFLTVFISTAFGGYGCLQDHCKHGICIDDLNNSTDYKCYCQNGFTGFGCELNWDECRTEFGPNPCKNGGTCQDRIAAYNCSCLDGFAGTNCEVDLTSCEETCQNNGTCKYDDQRGIVVCDCPPGFIGVHCEEDVSVCGSRDICQNGGQCKDGVGKNYHCICTEGWEGPHCEKNTDDCVSSPCQNGGMCVDQLADYTCACPFGFTGKACETKLDICENNPCQNGAFCLQEGKKKVCYCVPDFHGELCEDRYDECDPPENKCSNGGTCLDGVGTFTCQCPPNILGKTCQCTPDSQSAECLKLRDDMKNRTMTTTTTPASDHGDDTTTPDMCDDDDCATVVSPFPPMVTSSILSSDSPYDPGGSRTPTLTPTTSSIFGGMLTPSMTMITTFVEDPGDTAKTETYDPCPTMTDDSAVLMTPSIFMTSSIRDLMSSPSMSSSLDPNELITEFPPGVTSPTPSTFLPPFPSSTELFEVPDMTSSPLETSTWWVDRSPTAHPSESVPLSTSTPIISPGDYSSPLLGSSIWDGNSGQPRFDTASLDPSSSSFQSPGIIITATPPVGLTGTFETTFTVQPTAMPTPSLTVIGSDGLIPTASLSEGLVITSSKSWDDGSPPPSSSSEPFEPTTSSLTVSPTSLPTLSPPTTIYPNLTDPCDNYCQNDAKCISTSIEPMCVCPFKFRGKRCERALERVRLPSFSGNSFLKYELAGKAGNTIEITSQMATLVPDGILMYVALGRIYSLIYIQNGHVTLHFSCGAQTMHFVETKARVDNGYNFTLSFSLNYIVDQEEAGGHQEVRCSGQVRLNESYSMTGEQKVDPSVLLALEEPMIPQIFLGGLDQPDSHPNDDVIRIISGFRGCIYYLKVNEELVSLFDEAKDGREIAECSNFHCAINPCEGESRCVSSPKPPFWECWCPPGYNGTRCNIRTCTENPCKNGATCTTLSSDQTNFNDSASSTTYRCLCPLGYAGDLCQATINITKPAFHGTPDYSSFLAYDPIPGIADWLQLKFHFITHNMSQFALLMYVGSQADDRGGWRNQEVERLSSGSQPDQASLGTTGGSSVSDFFAISFLQGYIALTWNLGTGIRRIYTPSRINNRINVHTLYAGRYKKGAWLKVDEMRNITGKSPGVFDTLNVQSDLYVGGHEGPRFEGLPHDLPLHQGFQGCIFDLGFRIKNKLFLPRPLRGRNVTNCYHEDC